MCAYFIGRFGQKYRERKVAILDSAGNISHSSLPHDVHHQRTVASVVYYNSGTSRVEEEEEF
jgi:hypothetical protein